MSDGLDRLSAEHSVLGAMLIDPGCVRDVLPRLREDDFSIETNRTIFRALQAAQMGGKPFDALTVAEAMQADREVRDYLAQLMEITVTSANATEYADIVAENGKTARLREAIREAGRQMDEHEDESRVLGTLDDALRDYNESSAKDVLTPTEQVTHFYAYRERMEKGEAAYTRTGFRQLDRVLNGGLYNAVYFLAARPGIGKTTFALNVAEYVAEKVGPVCFLSMEMTEEQITARRLALEMKKPDGQNTAADSGALLTRKLTESEHMEMAAAAARIAERDFRLVAKDLSVEKASAIARACKGCRLVVMDHFTLLQRPHKDKDFAEYAEISHALARLAKGMRAPVLCLIQLNRDNEKNKKAWPKLSELRGSGSTEEDAGGVLFLHKENDAEDEDAKTEDGIAPDEIRVIVAKNRFGRTGSVDMSFFGAKSKFIEKYVG